MSRYTKVWIRKIYWDLELLLSEVMFKIDSDRFLLNSAKPKFFSYGASFRHADLEALINIKYNYSGYYKGTGKGETAGFRVITIGRNA